MRSASSTRWLLSYEDLLVGAEAVLVSNPDRNPWGAVIEIPLGNETQGHPPKVLDTKKICCIITT